MKRNNMFMWAYISFIFVSICTRIHCEYSLWSPLVMAVTISSILFAIEDLSSSFEKKLNDSCNTLETFVIKARKETEKELESLQDVKRQIKSCQECMSDLLPDVE